MLVNRPKTETNKQEGDAGGDNRTISHYKFKKKRKKEEKNTK